MTPRELLIEARKKIKNPENWTKGSYAKDKDGNKVDYKSTVATCWCTLGAIYSNASTILDWVNVKKAVNILQDTLHTDGVDNFHNIVIFNDSHSHGKILSLFDKAIKLAKKEEV